MYGNKKNWTVEKVLDPCRICRKEFREISFGWLVEKYRNGGREESDVGHVLYLILLHRPHLFFYLLPNANPFLSFPLPLFVFSFIPIYSLLNFLLKYYLILVQFWLLGFYNVCFGFYIFIFIFFVFLFYICIFIFCFF